jgi:hypothetical protein
MGITAEIKARQRWALLQHSRQPLCILCIHFTLRQRECGDAATGCKHHELRHDELQLFSGRAITGVVPEAPAQADNGRQAHFVNYLLDFLRGASQHDRPASRPSPAPVLCRNGFQSCSKGVSGKHLVFLCFPLSPSLLGRREQRGPNEGYWKFFLFFWLISD